MSDRDPVIARALRGLPVPDHGDRFWERLDRRLGEAAPSPSPAAAAAAAGDEPPPTVVVLEPAPAASGRWRPAWRAVSVAAALAAILGLIGALTTVRDGGRPRPAAPAAPVATSTTTSAPTPAPTAGPAPDAVVLSWLDALGAGDVTRAAELTGPRTAAYVDALGGSLAGYLTEAQEGYGAWADVADRSTTEVDLGTVGEDGVTIVVVSGAWRGEGEDGFRTEALPVVRGTDGRWRVEPAAFDPDTGGRLELVAPAPGSDGSGLGGLPADGAVEAAAPGGGDFWFSLDDAIPTRVDGRARDGGVTASFDPPGALPRRTHLLVVAYVDGDTVTAFAGTFAVEG